MNSLRVIGLSLAALVGWTLLVVVFVESSSNDPLPSRSPERAVDAAPAMSDGPTIIVIDDLRDLGIQDSLLSEIQPHFRVLNAALVTLVALHQQFDSANTVQAKRAIEDRAGIFHITADMHEETIEALLPAGLRARFHSYMRSREAAAGLPNDERWHKHGDGVHRYQFPQLHSVDSTHTGRQDIPKR